MMTWKKARPIRIHNQALSFAAEDTMGSWYLFKSEDTIFANAIKLA